jgi:hypothetical protein
VKALRKGAFLLSFPLILVKINQIDFNQKAQTKRSIDGQKPGKLIQKFNLTFAALYKGGEGLLRYR